MHPIWRSFLFGSGVLLLALTLAPYGTDGYRLLEFSSGYRPQLLLVGIVHGLFSLLLWRGLDRQRLDALVNGLAGVVIVINLVEVAPCYLARSQPQGNEAPLKILSFNVLGSNPRYADTLDYVQAEAPDVAIFLAAVGSWPDALRPLDTRYPHHLPVQVTEFEIYSKHPILHHELHFFGDYRGFIELTFEVHGRPQTVVAFHSYPNLYFGKHGFALRNQQLDALANTCRDARKPLIVIGDFNIDPWSPIYKRMMKKSGLKDARRGFGVGASHSIYPRAYRFPWLARPADACLVSPPVQVKSFKTGPFLGSDHLPIVVDVVLGGN